MDTEFAFKKYHQHLCLAAPANPCSATVVKCTRHVG